MDHQSQAIHSRSSIIRASSSTDSSVYRVLYILHCQARSPSIVRTKGKHGTSFETSQANRSLQRCLEGKLIPPKKQWQRQHSGGAGHRRPHEKRTNPNQETPGIFHKVVRGYRCRDEQEREEFPNSKFHNSRVKFKFKFKFNVHKSVKSIRCAKFRVARRRLRFSRMQMCR